METPFASSSAINVSRSTSSTGRSNEETAVEPGALWPPAARAPRLPRLEPFACTSQINFPKWPGRATDGGACSGGLDIEAFAAGGGRSVSISEADQLLRDRATGRLKTKRSVTVNHQIIVGAAAKREAFIF